LKYPLNFNGWMILLEIFNEFINNDILKN